MRHHVRELSHNVHDVPNIFNFPDHCTATTTHPAKMQTPTRRSYSVTQSSEEHRNRNPFSHIRVVASDVICGWSPDHCTATTFDLPCQTAETHSALIFGYPKLREANRNPFSHIRLRVDHHSCRRRSRQRCVWGWWGWCIRVNGTIQHGVNELFSLEPKDKQVETIQHLLGDRRGPIPMANAGSGKSIIFHPH
jgi:hypothetical protein